MTARVVHLPRRTHYCSSCGIPHRPMRPSETLCRVCYAWARVYQNVVATRKLLGGAR
jgi:hypothetical protein